MKTAIIYYSKHHGNTKKLLETIKAENEVALFDIAKGANINPDEYDCIGFASGIYYSKFHKSILKYAKDSFPNDKKTFFIYTYGAEKKGYTNAIREALADHHATILGEFGCFGFNTFGPFKLIGGIAKGHPDNNDIENVLKFYKEL